MLRFDKAINLSLLFKFILSVRSNNALWGSDVSLFLEFINTVLIFVLYLYWIRDIVKYLYTFWVIYFAKYKEHMICLISVSQFSDVLPACTCAIAIGNLWSTYLGLNILSPSPLVALCFASDASKE